MKTIYKYNIGIVDKQQIHLPVGHEILSVQTQGGAVCIWALIDTEAETQEELIEVFGTGHPVHVDMGIERQFIGTVQIMGGTQIYHVFKRL